MHQLAAAASPAGVGLPVGRRRDGDGAQRRSCRRRRWCRRWRASRSRSGRRWPAAQPRERAGPPTTSARAPTGGATVRRLRARVDSSSSHGHSQAVATVAVRRSARTGSQPSERLSVRAVRDGRVADPDARAGVARALRTGAITDLDGTGTCARVLPWRVAKGAVTYDFQGRRDRCLSASRCRLDRGNRRAHYQGREEDLPAAEGRAGRSDGAGSGRQRRDRRRPRRRRPGGSGPGVRGAARAAHRGADQLVASVQGQRREARLRRRQQGRRGRPRPVAPRQDRGLSAGEKRMLAKARQILVSELALAEGTNEDKAEVVLDEVLAEAVGLSHPHARPRWRRRSDDRRRHSRCRRCRVSGSAPGVPKAFVRGRAAARCSSTRSRASPRIPRVARRRRRGPAGRSTDGGRCVPDARGRGRWRDPAGVGRRRAGRARRRTSSSCWSTTSRAPFVPGRGHRPR